MTHLRHASPIRRASAAKRTALMTFAQIEAEANEDARRILREPWERVQAECDKAQEQELARQPNGGFIHG